jgi:hypothetical protein
MRPCTALGCLLALLVLGGCSNAHRTDEKSAQGAVDALLGTCAADRPQASLEVLDAPARDAFARAPSALEGCLEVLGLRPAGNQAAVRHAFGRTRVVGVSANAMAGAVVIEAPDGSRSRLEVENVRGDWRVAHPARPSAL